MDRDYIERIRRLRRRNGGMRGKSSDSCHSVSAEREAQDEDPKAEERAGKRTGGKALGCRIN